MLESITNLIKEQLADTVNKNADIAANKKEQVVETATTSVIDSLKSQFSMDNLSSLTSMFAGSSNANTNSELSSKLQISVLSSLTEKLGLSQSVANSIVSVAIPAIISTFQKKVNDPNDSTFSIESLIKSFSGDNKGGGLLGTLSGLFGK